VNIKEFLEPFMDEYCGFIIYDEATNKRKHFIHLDEVISEYGYFQVKGWKIEKDYGMSVKILIKTRTEV